MEENFDCRIAVEEIEREAEMNELIRELIREFGSLSENELNNVSK
jgi:hypothetical protein